MKVKQRLGHHTLLLAATLSTTIVHAQDMDPNTPQISQNTSNIATYLINLGAYLGYNVTQTPKAPISPLVSSTVTQLIPTTSTGGSSQLPFFSLMIQAFFDALPVNSLSEQFVPSNNTAYATLNKYANTTFKQYNSGSASQTFPSINSAIDQKNYQQDPVSQAILNILGTPDYTYCMNNEAKLWTGGTTTQDYPQCSFQYQYLVMSNVIGALPKPYEYFSPCYIQQFLSQLNSNTLIAPLMYSTDSSNSNSANQNECSNNNAQQPGTKDGLPAQNQLQEAENFIRYATGGVAPGTLPQLANYNTLYNQAMTPSTSTTVTPTQKLQAQATLINYFAKLRTYASQASVAYSNIYYVFSKRVPQTPSGGSSGDSSPTSQALTEFTMATWRLFTPSGESNPAWLNQINTASTATVQKEIATLLAEINYQLYLNRQQEERMLLTESVLLLLSSRSALPVAPTDTTSTPLQ